MSEIERILVAKEKKVKKTSYISELWRKVKAYLRVTFPKIYEVKNSLKKENTFSGWGMTTNTTAPPWKNTNLKENIFFDEINKGLIKKINNQDFKLSQFNYHDADYQKILNECQWRHYIVFNSVLNTLRFIENNEVNLVECGVCDGLTINFAMEACNYKKIDYKSYLYDAWENLDNLDEELRFNYDYLKIETTKFNLKKFSNNTIYNKGFIPDVFKNSANPKKIHWLHIDLNSNEATNDSLNFFYDKIEINGLILFDDYGGFKDTRKIVDNFFTDKDGHFINFPTGQAIFYKKN